MSRSNFSKAAQTVIEAEEIASHFFYATDPVKKRSYQIMFEQHTSKPWRSAYVKQLGKLQRLCPSKEGIKADDWANMNYGKGVA